jgi:CRP/FNR family transcriptional regulator, cyclic AMP receptor protein
MESRGAPQSDRFLELLEPEDREAVTAAAGPRRFLRGAALVHQGTAAEEVLILLSGRVKVSSGTPEGKEIVLRFCGPGDVIGEMAVVEGVSRSATVEAIEPVEAIALPAERFRGLIRTRPGVALALLRAMSRRFRDADRKRVEFGASHALGRVASRLVELAEGYGHPEADTIVIDLPISQEELAGWTGCSREAVAKALRALRDLGLIETQRRRIGVRDLEALASRAR